jgi:hypothetical protein
MVRVNDDRIIAFERALWVGEADVYRRCVPTAPIAALGEESNRGRR